MSTEPQIIHRPRKWPIYVGSIFALLIVLYFVVTSSPFIRRFVLPSVETALGSKLTVGELSLSPFSQLELRQVTLTPNGAEPLLKVDLVRVRYRLMALLGGQIQAQEVTLENPIVTLIEKADGSRNLPKLPSSEPKPASELKLDLHQVQLRNGAVTFLKQNPSGTSERTEIAGINLTMDQLVTGQAGKLTLTASARLDKSAADNVVGKLAGELAITPGKWGLPVLLKGNVKLDLTAATGTFKEVDGLGLAFEADVTEKEVRDLRFSFRRLDQELGRFRISGPYDATKPEARLNYELTGLDRRVLALFGSAAGFDVGETSISAQGRVDVAQDGRLVASNGELTIRQLSLANSLGRTPAIDLVTRYKISANLGENAALMELFEVTGKDPRGEWITGALDRPMNVAWGKAPAGFREASLIFKLSRFNLGEWRTVLGTNAPDGSVHADLSLTAERDGRLIRFKLAGAAEQLRATVGAGQLTDGVVELSSAGTVSDFQQIVVEKFSLNLKQAGSQLLTATGMADWSLKTQQGGAQFTSEGEAPALLALAPMTGVGAQSGHFKLNAQANQKTSVATVSLTLGLNQFSGHLNDQVFNDYQTTLQLNVSKVGDLIDIQRFNLAAGTGFAPGGNLDASGRWNLTKRAGAFDYKIGGLNESALQPFLAPLLKPNRLQSVTITSGGQAEVDLSAASTITTDFKIGNFRTQSASGESMPPIELGFKIEASGKQTVLDLKRFTLLLGATEQAKNELTISGRIDLSTNRPAPTTLSIRSDGLDLTPLYKLLVGDVSSNSTPVTSRVPNSQPPTEPAAITFPIRQVTAELDITKIQLGKIAIAHWKSRAELNQSVVTLKPFELSLNGSPVTFSLNANLGTPGWQYDFNLTAPDLALAPFVDTFRPQYQGKITGTLSAQAAFKGSGITGAGFQKNLNGSLQVHSTNLNVNLAGLQDAKKKQAAQLISKPKDGILSLIGNAFQSISGGTAGPSWYEEISRSPVDTITLLMEAGAGRLTIKEGLVQSPVLRAQPSGHLAFAPVLNDSTLNIPVALALRGAVARQLGLSNDTNQFVSLPPMVAIGGTVGTPEPKVDKFAVAQLLLKTQIGGGVGGLLNSVTDGKSGALADQVGNLLNAVTGPKSPAPATATANPAPGAPAQPVQSQVRDLLKNFSTPGTAPAPAVAPSPTATPKPVRPPAPAQAPAATGTPIASPVKPATPAPLSVSTKPTSPAVPADATPRNVKPASVSPTTNAAVVTNLTNKISATALKNTPKRTNGPTDNKVLTNAPASK